jgi:hypothetical protein
MDGLAAGAGGDVAAVQAVADAPEPGRRGAHGGDAGYGRPQKVCRVLGIRRAMGHRSAVTTLQVYSHWWPGAEARAEDPDPRGRRGPHEVGGDVGTVADRSTE